MIEMKVQPEIPSAEIKIEVSGPGKDGRTPVRGVDYWTEEEQREIRSFSAGALIAEESGEQVAVCPDAGSPMQLKVKLAPVQSGVPSADNIVPITGWSEVRVSEYGANLFDAGFELGTINATTGAEGNASATVRSGFVPVVPGLHYTFSRTVSTASNAIRGYGADKQYIGSAAAILDLINGTTVSSPMGTGATQATVRFKEGVRYIRVVDFSGNLSTLYQMELGDAFTPYQPVQREDWDFSFGQTVFGGELDASGGILTVTHGEIAFYNGEALPGEWLSDRDVYAEGAVPTIGAQVVYVLAEPYEVNREAINMLASEGVNTLHADGCRITVNHHKSLTRAVQEIYAYIDSKIAAML